MTDLALLTDSKKAAWQAIVALAKVDGEIEAQEKAVLLNYIRANRFSKDLENHLIANIDNPIDFETCYDAITDVRDRAYVISTALVLFHADEDFEHAEQKLFQQLNDKQREQVDYKAASGKAREYTKQFLVDYKSARAEERKSSSLIERWIDSVGDFFDSNWDLDG